MASSLQLLARNFGEGYRSALAAFRRASSIILKIPSKSLVRRALCTAAATETRTQKLERISDDILALSKIEHRNYVMLLRDKLGINLPGPQSPSPAAGGKTSFDVKLDKFESAAKFSVATEVSSFADISLDEAVSLVEKAPVVVKKGVTKEDAQKISQKLKEVGATVALESNPKTKLKLDE